MTVVAGIRQAQAIDPGERSGDDPLRAIAMIVCSGVLFAITDAVVKFLTAELPPAQIAWSRYLFYLPILVPWALARRRQLKVASRMMQATRGGLMLASTLIATVAIADLPLAEMSTISFTGPLATTVLSIFLLSERVGPRRWAAVIVGFVGVLVVMRPGGVATGWPALLALAATIIWSLGFVLTRRLGARDSAVATLCWTTAVGLVGAGAMMVPTWTWPSAFAWTLLAFNGAGNLLGQWLVIRALERAAASIIAPLIYVQLAWASLLGWLVFHQVPDGGTVAGATLIVASGLYVWHRERVRASLRRTA